MSQLGEHQPLATCEGREYYIGNENNDEKSTSTASSSPPPPPKTSGYSQSSISLDFERIVNEYSIQACRDRMSNLISADVLGFNSSRTTLSEHNLKQRLPSNILVGHVGRKVTRWALTVMAGIMTGLTTVIIMSISEKVVEWRVQRLDSMITDPNDPDILVFIRFSLFSLCLALCSSLLCVSWIPAAEGSGIPEVKAYLNGVRVKRFSSWNLFLVKIVGTILSVASSLAVGKEGPLIHIAILSRLLAARFASGLVSPFSQDENSMLTKIWIWTTSDLAYFANDTEKRDLVSIGAAVGFAASFGAPVGGLLFILDDISSHFNRSMSLRVLVANAFGTFCLALYRRDLSKYSVISLGDFYEPNDNIFVNRFEEVPFYVLTGVVGGLLGGFFSVVLEFRKRRMKHILSGKVSKLIEVMVLSIFTSFLLFYVSSMEWTCRDIVDKEKYEAVNAGYRFFCREDQVNSLATILLGSRDLAIRWILTDPHQFQGQTLFVVGALFYVLTLLTNGSALPLGVFTPTVLIGASLGGSFGLMLQDYVDSHITPSTFALLGVAAMLAGVQRSTVSICVILVEGTGQIRVLIPVIITVVVARYVAQFVHQYGIHELGMALKGYPYLEQKEARVYDMIEVGDIMSKPPVTVRPLEMAMKLVKLLENSTRHGFPVVDNNGRFIGLVRRNQIVALLECGIFEDVVENTEESPSSTGERKTPRWAPQPGVHKSPLMHWAFHIKDDRYHHIESRNLDDSDNDDGDDLEDDEFDLNTYLLSIRDIVDSFPPEMERTMRETDRNISFAGDDALPPLNSTPMKVLRKMRSRKSIALFSQQGSSEPQISPSPSRTKVPTGIAKVGSGGLSGKTVVIKWLHPDHRNKYVNLSAVMNRGAVCVPHYFPLSKAYSLFTKLGLRWLVVIGGASGGEVVGILTRRNLLPSHIQECTGSRF